MMTQIAATPFAGRRRPSASTARRRGWVKVSRYSTGLAALAAALAASAIVNHRLAKRAERRNPPSGRFVEVEGVRLHYVERGEGPALVLLHGNGSMIADFESSGLIDLAARRHRVIVFDRPGYGHSERPRSRLWTADHQARLIGSALARIGVSDALVLGHSWGASVAVTLALRYPRAVRGLVLASGYYYPTARADAALLSGPAVPILGDIALHTVSPLVGRLIWPLLMRKIFGPAPVPAKFGSFPREMALRPSQIRAEAEESALMVPTAAGAASRYSSLKMPVIVVAGAEDRLIDVTEQSGRLHRAVSQSRFRTVPGSGHMVHQTNPAAVMAAIDEVARLAA